jgi:catechol 2,3-dioxygenase-like lactoylglutathione lyase family enzyme
MFNDAPLIAMLPASDIERAKAWYAEKLDLKPTNEDPSGLEYEAGGTRFSVFPSAFAGTNQATAAGFEVENVEKAVEQLTAKGVTFEQYDLEYLKTDERGIADVEGWKGAWFKDSEGNILAVAEAPPKA